MPLAFPRGADWQSAVSRIGNPQTIQPFNPTVAPPVANRRHGRLAICATGQDFDKGGMRPLRAKTKNESLKSED